MAEPEFFGRSAKRYHAVLFAALPSPATRRRFRKSGSGKFFVYFFAAHRGRKEYMKIMCEVPGCGFKTTSDRMWALRKQGGELAKICGRCAHEARANGVRRGIDRLDAVLARSAFFQAFKKAGEKRSAKPATPVPPTAPIPIATEAL